MPWGLGKQHCFSSGYSLQRSFGGTNSGSGAEPQNPREPNEGQNVAYIYYRSTLTLQE